MQKPLGRKEVATMMNHEMMTLKLKRIDVCDIRAALANVIFDMRDELNDPNTSETRKKILANSIGKWEAIRAEVIRQFKEQDAE